MPLSNVSGLVACCLKCYIVQKACKGIHHVGRGRGHDVVGCSGERFICSPCTLAVNAPGICGQIDLFLLGPSLFVGITALPLVSLLFVVPRLEYGGGRIHG